jgi:hypothetical protein
MRCHVLTFFHLLEKKHAVFSRLELAASHHFRWMKFVAGLHVRRVTMRKQAPDCPPYLSFAGRGTVLKSARMQKRAGNKGDS